MTSDEFKCNSFKLLNSLADIYWDNPEFSKQFDLWITQSTENGADQITLTVKEKEV